MKKGVALLRVSTPRQKRSGLGLAAQERIVRYFFKINRIVLVKIFIEHGSGRPRKRPKAQKAIDYCRKQNIPLYVANQSRLARNVGLIYDLIESGFEFINIECPAADKYQKLFQAIIDEKAADDISRNTKNSLISAAKKGTKFGGNSRKRKRTMERKKKAHIKRMRPIIRRLWQKGFCTVRAIMDKLIIKGVKNFQGVRGAWHISTVYQLLKDLKYL
ncbi:MAG: recombinase family protein [Niastella sp.]|nr:recombinase family protein [Niastella sp.]